MTAPADPGAAIASYLAIRGDHENVGMGLIAIALGRAKETVQAVSELFTVLGGREALAA